MSLISLMSMGSERSRFEPAFKSKSPAFELKVKTKDLQQKPPQAPPPPDAKKSVTDALTKIAAYVPTEIIGVYTVVLATYPPPTGRGLPMWVFWAFLVGTPVLAWMVLAVQKAEEKKKVPWSPKKWPKWKMASAAIAFTVWSAAMPGSAFMRYDSWYDSRGAGILLVVVALLLPKIGVLVANRWGSDEE